MPKYYAHSSTSSDKSNWQPLSDHLNEVGAIAAKLASKLGIPLAGKLIGLMHDFGKYSQQFQDYLASASGALNPDEDGWVDAGQKKGKIDHSTAGAQWLYQRLALRGSKDQGQLCAQILALCIASHHSGLIDCLDLEGNDNFDKRIKKGDEKAHLPECIMNADTQIMRAAEQLADEPMLRELLAKLKSILKDAEQDVLLLDTSTRHVIQEFYLGFFTRFLFSCLIDADRMNSADFDDPEKATARSKDVPDWSLVQARLEKKLATFSSDEPIAHIRKSISDNCSNRGADDQGLFTLSVPTGGGKTLASLRFALAHAKKHNLERIFYIIPYTSIIEQNAKEVRDILGADWVLEHHSNLEPEQQTWQSKITSENWDMPIVFTTMVQYLETQFGGGTRGVRRLHQLADSVVIFDEIQTLPINCVHLFCNALNFLVQYAGTTAVLCTATQPLLNQLKNPMRGALKIDPKNEIVGAAEVIRQLFADLQRVDICDERKIDGWSLESITDKVCEEFDAHGSCLLIVNTKQWAQNVYLAAEKKGIDKGALFHLSTNQCPAHRQVLLDDIRTRLKNKQPVLCISTQLIEAGVDLSFKTVVRFLAGLDSIAQAAGRCNRHGEMKDVLGNALRGQVFIVNPDAENIDMLEDIKIGQEKTIRVLTEQDISAADLLTPKGIARYFTYYFHDRSDVMTYPLKTPTSAGSLLNLLSDNPLNNYAKKNQVRKADHKFPLLMQSFMAAGNAFKAIDAPTQAVIVPYEEEGNKIVTQLCCIALQDKKNYRKLLQQAQKYSVNVFPNVWKKLKESSAVFETQPGSGIFCLREQHYSSDFGLSADSVGTMTASIV
jgi:CRISPR-associated endonuclease/helicase Cas3